TSLAAMLELVCSHEGIKPSRDWTTSSPGAISPCGVSSCCLHRPLVPAPPPSGNSRRAWSFLSSALLGHRFAAMKVETDRLVHVDPFKLLARGLPSGTFSVGSQTLAVIGATFGGGRIGFYLGQRVWCIAAENRKRGSTA